MDGPVTDEAGARVSVYGGRAPLVRKNPESDWNLSCRYEEALFKVQPYNVVFWGKNYFDPNCQEYVVLARPAGRLYDPKKTSMLSLYFVSLIILVLQSL